MVTQTTAITTTTTTTTENPTTAKELVKQTIQQALSNHASEFTSIDLLREFRRQSELLGETERIRELLISDPFEHWKEKASLAKQIEHLGERLQVVDVHRVATLSGYSFMDTVLEIPKIVSSSKERRHNGKEKLKKKMERCTIEDRPKNDDTSTQLMFRYERRAEEVTSTGPRRIDPGIDPPTVWYSIDLSDGMGPLQRLLWVQVWADGHRRAEHLTAVNLEEDEDGSEDGWEDIDEDDNEVDVIQEQKRQRMDDKMEQREVMKQPNESKVLETPGSSTAERADRYVAGIDPEVLQTFVDWIGLGSNSGASEVTVFFLLMTFPFFEHEWDIIGYLLESVFGAGSDDDDEGKDGGNEHDD